MANWNHPIPSSSRKVKASPQDVGPGALRDRLRRPDPTSQTEAMRQWGVPIMTGQGVTQKAPRPGCWRKAPILGKGHVQGELLSQDPMHLVARRGQTVPEVGRRHHPTARPRVSLGSVTILLAAAAGAASFLSPCVLPLVPAYLAFLSHSAASTTCQVPPRLNSSGTRDPVPRTVRWRALRGGAGFVLGLGVFVSTFFYALYRLLGPWKPVATPIMGAVVIVLGLSLMGILQLPWLGRDIRWLPWRFDNGGFAAGVLLGLGMGAGWTPCIGPVLGAVLTSGISQGTTVRGLYVMAAYTVGLGFPFLITALLADRVVPLVQGVNRHQRPISFLGGAVVVAMGLLVMVGHFTLFNDWLSAHLPPFFQDPFHL